MCSVVEDVRNFSEASKAAMRQFIKDTFVALDNPAFEKLPGQLKELREATVEVVVSEAGIELRSTSPKSPRPPENE